MREIFLDVFNAGIAAGWIAAAIIVLRLILKRVPGYIYCILWNIVLIRLILPVKGIFPRTRFSFIPSDMTVFRGDGNVSFAFNTGFSGVDRALNERADNRLFEGITVEMGYYDKITMILSVIWIAAAICLLVYGIVCYVKLRQSIKEAVLYKDNVYRCESAAGSPFILGVIRPRIYLGYGICGEDEELILAHEKAHLARRDNLVKLLWCVVLCIYWFNPLIWAAYILMCRDMERACDEKVLSGRGADVRKAYAEALLACASGKRHTMAYPAAFSETDVKSRIKNVMSFRKPGKAVTAACVVLTAVFALGFLTNPVLAASDEEVYSYYPAGDSSGYGIPSLIFTENGNRCTFVRFSMDSDFITGSCYEENDVFILTDESSGNEYVFDIQGAGERKIYIFNEEESAPLAEYAIDSGPGYVEKVKVPDGAVFQRKWTNILDAEEGR